MNTSIAMATYNGERYLEQQLQSFIDQTRLPDELVVCDDRSSDNTWEMLNAFAANSPFPVRLNRNQRNLGVTSNFEAALALARGDVIFLSDQDDVWKPEKLMSICEKFAADRSVGMVFTDADIVDDRLRPLNETLWSSWNITNSERKHFDRAPFDFLVTNRNIVTGATAAFSRDVVRAALPLPKQMAILHDAWLAIIAAELSTVVALPDRLIEYRQHAAQQTGVRKARPEIGRRHYELHLQQLIALSSRLAQIAPEKTDANRIIVDGYITHLKARLALPNGIGGRLLPVASELFSGRYRRYSSGIRSAVKDLIRPTGG